MTAPDTDPFLALTDAASLDAAVSMRAAVRGRLDRAIETATWVGTLRDLAERRLPVLIRVGSRVTRGVLTAVANDHVAVRRADGVDVLIVQDALCWVRPEPGTHASVAVGDRSAPVDHTLAEVVARLLEVDAELGLVLRGTDEAVSGSLVAFGQDVFTLRTAGGEPSIVYVPLAAVSEVLVRR